MRLYNLAKVYIILRLSNLCSKYIQPKICRIDLDTKKILPYLFSPNNTFFTTNCLPIIKNTITLPHIKRYNKNERTDMHIATILNKYWWWFSFKD